jgi:peptidoglycan/LPS O-acetylase OafA/YrhL
MGRPLAYAPSARTHELACVDFLRVIAAFLVFLEHLDWVTASSDGASRRPSFFLGGWGVNCFFVLSGFLLGKPYVQALLEGTPLQSTKAYLLRRFYRIWPLYAVCILFILINLAQAHPTLIKTYVLELFFYLTMSHNFCATCTYDNDYMMQMWTMAVDAQFYVLLPLIALATARVFHGKRQRLRGIVYLIAATVPISLLVRHWGYDTMLASGSLDWIFYLRNIAGMSVAFALGVGLNLPRSGGFTPEPRIAFAIGMVGIALVPLIQITHDLPALLPFSLYDLVGAASAACILYGFLEGGFPGTARFMHARPMKTLAEYTYGFYLLHIWMLHMVYYDLGRLLYDHYGTLRFEAEIGCVCLVVTLAVASVTYRYIEQPFLRMKERHLPQNAARLQASAQVV